MGCDGKTVTVGSGLKDEISIHAARVGCDGNGTGIIDADYRGISIHAARVGCDIFVRVKVLIK